MRITAVGMLKNEADVVHLFAGHLAALCDSVVIADNVSTDGTSEFLAELAEADDRFEVYRFAEPGYEQSLLMSTIVHQVPAAIDCDWVLAIDADEFVEVADREELEDRLREHVSLPVVTLPWKNVVPDSFAETRFDRDRKVWVPQTIARHCGIAVNRAALRDDTTFAIGQGNHAVLNRPGGTRLPARPGASLLHVPIRSEGQIVCKATQGVRAYQANAGVQDRRQGSHWQLFLDAYQRGEIGHDQLAGFAAEYGMVGDELPSLDWSTLSDRGYTQTTLDVPFDDGNLPPAPSLDTMAQLMALAVGAVDAEAPVVPLRKLTVSDRAIVRAPDDRGVRYGPLPGRSPVEVIDPDRPLASFVEPHGWPIATVVPTSWGGHIPFLFCLINAHRPRRFVELGTHHGASFFAACQAVQRLGLDTECVAIDTWEGDPQAGYYGEKVYNRFVDELSQRGYHFAGWIRAMFDDAVDEFDDGSIDLLHIDGLHTYEAVSNDFRTWRPKLTDDAVVIFHDTAVFEPDFGVWRFFQQVSSDYLTFNFRHTHGLGVLVNHGAVHHPIGRFVAELASDPGLANFAELLFESAGPRAVAEAQLRALTGDLGENPYKLARGVARTEAKLAKAQLDIKKLQRQVSAARRGEREARSDLRWLLGRLDGTPARVLLRRFAGYEKLRKKWLDG